MSKSQVCACCTHEVYGSGKLLALFICSKCGRFRLAWQGNALPCFALLDQRWEESDLGEKPQRRGAFFIVVVARDEGRVPAGQVTTPGVAGNPNQNK